MGQLWVPRTTEILKYWVETILEEASDDLSDWEERFVEDMRQRIERGSRLTQSQEEKLEEIYADKTKL